MRLRSPVLLMLLSAAFPEAFADDTLISGPTTALVRDSQGKPVISSAGDCWHSSLPAPAGATMAAGCRAPSSESVAVSRVAEQAAPAEPEQAFASGPSGESIEAAGASTAGAAGSTTRGGGAPAYVTDSRGMVVRGSSGDCWRTGTWTPSQATVVGCDGVLARALPVPAPAEPGKATQEAPSAQPSAQPPSTVTPSQAPPVAPPASPPARSARAAPVAPALPTPAPSAPPALAPEGTQAAPTEPSSEKVTFDTDTFFDFDKSVLKPAGREKLDALSRKLADATVEVVVAVGHADATGPSAYNQRLSERRARAVVEYLREKGLPREKIFSEGKGETQPIASNASKAGRAKNRRVEVEVVAIRSKK